MLKDRGTKYDETTAGTTQVECELYSLVQIKETHSSFKNETLYLMPTNVVHCSFDKVVPSLN